MSHHLSGPDLRSPKDEPRLDMTDLFVFPAATAGHTAIILDVNPDPGAAPGLHPDATYQIHIDTNGDNQPDITYNFVFSELRDGGQTVTVLKATGDEAGGLAPVGVTIANDIPVGLSGEVNDVESSGHRIAAGLRSDPFFADLEGIINNFQWTGRDAMAEANVISLAMEVPDGDLGDVFSVWGRVTLDDGTGHESIDRGAHPSVTAYFNQENDEKNAYNAGVPANDEADHLDRFVAVLEHIGNWDAAAARETLLATIVPDALRFDRSQQVAYPNGRALTDDVTSARLRMMSNGKIEGDNIPPHSDLLAEFPYLGAPHPAVAAE